MHLKSPAKQKIPLLCNTERSQYSYVNVKMGFM